MKNEHLKKKLATEHFHNMNANLTNSAEKQPYTLLQSVILWLTAGTFTPETTTWKLCNPQGSTI